ncbi:MAG: hypothetical protein QW203_07210 [Thermoplasmatales archaeon]
MKTSCVLVTVLDKLISVVAISPTGEFNITLWSDVPLAPSKTIP